MAKSPEHDHQCALFRWAAHQNKRYPALDLLYAVPNGGWRLPATAARLKAEGVKAGVPDCCLPVARGLFHGLYIEMKAGRNKPTKEQILWHIRLTREGYRVAVCYTWEAAREIITEYLGGHI